MKGEPHEWIARWGRPADVMFGREADGTEWMRGLPSYESEHRIILVFDNMIAFQLSEGFRDFGSFAGAHDDGFLFLSASYGASAIRSVLAGGDGLCPLHDDPEALWTWRPLMYRLTGEGMQGMGSQVELEYRYGIVWGIEDQAMRQPDRRLAANKKAKQALWEHLDGQQRLDLLGWGHFFVRGQVNKLYKIEPGSGCAIVDAITREPVVSICLHPEEWLPHDDVALATKLLIESGNEEELLEGGNATPLKRMVRPTWQGRKAAELEAALA